MPAQTVIKVRRDTAANWISVDPTLASGEIGFETDTNQLKIGNGSSAWTALDYTSGGASVEISETAPASPDEGNVWFNSTDGRAYIYYDSTWVDLNPGIAGPPGPSGVVPSTTAPSDTSVLWLDTDETPDVPVPAGGTDGQVLTKTSSADYATAWENIPVSDALLPAGGTTGQVLAKSSNTNYATQWVAPAPSVLVGSSTFTAQTSVALDNIFTADYRFYDYYLTATGSTGAALSARLRTGSTDLSTSTYRVQTLISDGTTTTSTTDGTTTQWNLSNTRARMFWKHGTITNPFIADSTGFGYFGTDNISDGQLRLDQGVGNNTTASSYNGIRFFVSSGTMTGQLSIYGRRS